MIFGVLNPEKIRHQWLVHFPTSPVYCSHFTLGNPKKSFFNSIIHTYFSLFTLFISEENKLLPAVTVQQYGKWVSQKMEWTAQVAQGKTI